MYQQKYLKYKTKYINLKNEIMGGSQKGHKKSKEVEAERDEARKETSRQIAEVERKLGEKDKSYQAELKITIESYERELARANALDQELESKAPSKQVIDRIKQKDRDLLELRSEVGRGKTKRERLTQELEELNSVLLESRSSKEDIEKELADVKSQLSIMTEDQRLENSKKQEIIEEMPTQVSFLGQNNTDLEQKVLELEGIINEKDRRRAKLLDAVGRLTNYLANNAQPKRVNSFW